MVTHALLQAEGLVKVYGHRRVVNGVGLVVECAVPDDIRESTIDIDNRRKAQIDVARPQLGGEQPASFPSGTQRSRGLCIVEMADGPHSRETREGLAKALHASTFMVDRYQQLRLADGANRRDEVTQLIQIDEITRKQNDTADGRLGEPVCLFGTQRRAAQIDHQRP